MHFPYAYLVLNAPFILLWLVLFLVLPRSRKEMLTISAICGLLGCIEPVIAQDYFVPEYTFPLARGLGVEDFAFAFFSGGIATVVGDAVFWKQWSKITNKDHASLFFALYAVGFTLYLIMTLGLHTPSMMTSTGLMLSVVCVQWYMRPDLMIYSLLCGIITTGVVISLYEMSFVLLYPNITHVWWTSSWYILDIPYEEYHFAFSWGCFASIAYKFMVGLTDSIKSNKKGVSYGTFI